MKSVKLTDEETAALTTEHAKLKAQTEQQHQEQAATIRAHILQDASLSTEQKNRLIAHIDNDFKITMFRAYTADNGQFLVEVAVSFPDELALYLESSPDPVMRATFHSGAELKSKPAAVDLLPQTGKRRKKL